MNDIVITNFNDFEKSISVFKESLDKIEEIFDKQDKTVEQINSTEIWTGQIQKTIYNKYIELHENYELIEDALSTYIRFMQKVLSDYKKLEETIDKNASDNAVQLDINS